MQLQNGGVCWASAGSTRHSALTDVEPARGPRPLNPVWSLTDEPVCFQRFQFGRCQPHLLAVAPLNEASVVREPLVFGKLRGEHSLLLPKRLPLPQKRRMLIVACVGRQLPPVASSLLANPVASQAAQSINARINACSRIGHPRRFQGLWVRLRPKQGI